MISLCNIIRFLRHVLVEVANIPSINDRFEHLMSLKKYFKTSLNLRALMRVQFHSFLEAVIALRASCVTVLNELIVGTLTYLTEISPALYLLVQVTQNIYSEYDEVCTDERRPY